MKVVGAALKKIAVALVSNPQNWKTIGGIILVLIIVVIIPVAVIVAILNGNIEIWNCQYYLTHFYRKNFKQPCSLVHSKVFSLQPEGVPR